MSYTHSGNPIGRSGHSEQLKNDPRGRRNGQIQSTAELELGTGLEITNTGSMAVKAALPIAEQKSVDATVYRVVHTPGYLETHQTVTDPDITGSTADSLTALKAGVLAVEAKVNAALSEIALKTDEHLAAYNEALHSLQAEQVMLRSLITSLQNGGFVKK